MGRESGADRFGALMAAGGSGVDLADAALAISATLQPDLDPATWLAELDALAARCEDHTVDGVVRFLFDIEHFVGNRTAYHDWRNSCLDRVIATRTGIPITLSVLTIEVARRVGVGLVGVGMPAHFLVRSAVDADLFVDPFDQGRRLDRRSARALFDGLTRGQVPWREEYLAPTPNRDVVIRMLNNLKGVFAARADLVRLGLTMDLRARLPELAEAEAAEIAVAAAVFN